MPESILHAPVEASRKAGGEVYLIGNRYGHHARHSGYEGFRRYVGSSLTPPVGFRFLKIAGFPTLGWQIDSAIGKMMRRECYSLALLLTESSAAFHAMLHPGATYHFLYGDTDVCWLGSLRNICGVRVIATFHEAPEGLEYLGIDSRITDNLDAVVLVSESQRAYFAKHLPPERIFVVPHGIDTEFFVPAPAVKRERMCLTVGGHLRDFETLGRAIDIVHSTDPSVQFVAVGVDHGHEGPRFSHPSVKLLSGISDEELRSLYQSAGAAIFSFRQASANNSILEALACAAPVVATDVGGVREYVGGGGLLFSPGDAAGMASAILRVLDDQQYAIALGDSGRQAALAHDYRIVAKKQAEVYATVAARRAAEA
jgi:glycosyltransferase involved in cell wall biosynthesis